VGVERKIEEKEEKKEKEGEGRDIKVDFLYACLQ
jgi:hypothetical protein